MEKAREEDEVSSAGYNGISHVGCYLECLVKQGSTTVACAKYLVKSIQTKNLATMSEILYV